MTVDRGGPCLVLTQHARSPRVRCLRSKNAFQCSRPTTEGVLPSMHFFLEQGREHHFSIRVEDCPASTHHAQRCTISLKNNVVLFEVPAAMTECWEPIVSSPASHLAQTLNLGRGRLSKSCASSFATVCMCSWFAMGWWSGHEGSVSAVGEAAQRFEGSARQARGIRGSPLAVPGSQPDREQSPNPKASTEVLQAAVKQVQEDIRELRGAMTAITKGNGNMYRCVLVMLTLVFFVSFVCAEPSRGFFTSLKS